jgi:hypothetical protein
MSGIESEESSNNKESNRITNELLSENQYLRNCLQNVIGNVLNKEIYNASECKVSEKPIIPKKKRNPTQINFDFLEKEDTEKSKNEDNQVNSV